MTLKPDKYQIKAIKASENRVLVVAAPGSGKTTVILERVIHIMKSREVKAGNIIVITFTRAAAENMKRRFQNSLPSDESPFFGTFHGLFYKILRRHRGDINIIAPSLSFNLINNTLQKYMEEVGEDKVKEVLNNISLKKSMEIQGEAFKPSIDSAVFFQCLETYEEYKEKHNLWDFDDIQIEAYKLFKNDKQILQSYRRLFKHILVDEFQDCDNLQIELLKLLIEGNNLFAVGDEDQSIYAFRGSNPQCMVEFQERFPGGKKYFLSFNYRSTKNIIEGSKNLIAYNKERYSKEIMPFRKDTGSIRVRYVYNESVEAEEIALYIQEEKRKGNKFSSNAVLFRTNQEARGVIDAFIRRKIPFLLLDKVYNFYDHFICRDIIAYLKLSIDNTDRESFLRIINKPFRYISRSALNEVKSYPYVKDAFQILKDVKDIPVFQLKNIDALKRDINSLNKASLSGAIHRILTELGYLDYLRDYSSKNKLLFDDLQGIIDEFNLAAEEHKSIIGLLAYIEEYSKELRESYQSNGDNSVILSTIHGVKGMEFPNVFIINCCEDYLPHKNSSEENIEEERRLFYVGVTRAINNLFIFSPKMTLGKERTVSRFIKESAFLSLEQKEIPFEVGDEIFHKSFYEGKVSYIDESTIEINFKDDIKRRFDLSILLSRGLIKKL